MYSLMGFKFVAAKRHSTIYSLAFAIPQAVYFSCTLPGAGFMITHISILVAIREQASSQSFRSSRCSQQVHLSKIS
jgi:hypothetical protein